MTPQLKQPEIIQPMQFIDLKSQLELIRPQIDAAIKRVLDHGTLSWGQKYTPLKSN